MDIMVKGTASKFFKPDGVSFNITFSTKMKTYEEALKEGAKNVEDFINLIIEKLGVDKKELKTRSFTVTEVNRYDYEKKRNFKEGFMYSQYATLKIDYDMKKVGKFMEEISKLKNPPVCRVNFEVKNEEKAKSLVIAEAYSKAEEKAKMIALAAGKKLKKCAKVDFRPFEERVMSNSDLDYSLFSEKRMRRDVSDVIENIFTPEDVEISETLYCLWIAE